MLRGWAVTVAVLVLGAAGVGSASAESWQVQPAANPPTPPANLAAVSCLTVACTAVGWWTSTDIGDQTLAERGQGGSWAIQQTANPQGVSGGGGDFSAVSCPGQRRCEAVGNTTDSIGNQVFAEGWNGSRWSLQNVPEPADDTDNLENPPSDFLQGVSCAGINFCVAVGSYRNTGGTMFPLTERWNGKTWKALPKARLSAGKQLDVVSCSGPRACTAVGGTIADRWNGRSWTVQPAARPPGARRLRLMGVACVSARRCIAVGAYTRGTRLTLAELWNGRKWSVLRTPGSGELDGVSCPSAGVCVAVGAGSGGRTALAERWNGRGWAVQATPSQAGDLTAVSCSGASACTAVGDVTHGPAVLVYS